MSNLVAHGRINWILFRWVKMHGGLPELKFPPKTAMTVEAASGIVGRSFPSRYHVEAFLHEIIAQHPHLSVFRIDLKRAKGNGKHKPEVPVLDSVYTRKAYQELIESPEWRRARYAVLRDSGGRCALCGASRKDGCVLHVDHIIPASIDWSRRLDVTNLQVLCEDCNIGKSNLYSDDWR